MNDEVKKNILQMFGKIPEAMLIINNGIYCDAETDGMFYYRMGITDSLFNPERINDYIIRRPYPNKRVDQISKKIGRNVFKAGYPLLYHGASELNGRKYLAFDVWIGLGVHPKDLSTAPDACHIYVPLDIHATKDKPFVSFLFHFCQTAVLPDGIESTNEIVYPTEFRFGFYIETYRVEENGSIYPHIYPTRWGTDEQTMGRPFPCHKLLTLDESLTDKNHNIYVYCPIDVNGQTIDNTAIMYT